MTAIYSVSGAPSEAEKLQEFTYVPKPPAQSKGKGIVAVFIIGLLLAATGNAVSSTKRKK